MSNTKVTLQMHKEAMERLKKAVQADQVCRDILLKMGVLELQFPNPDLGVEVVKLTKEEAP